MATSKLTGGLAILACFFAALITLSGCAEINPFEATKEVFQHPLGTDPIRVGMTKEEVKGLWGSPSQINKLESKDQWQTPREEWVYLARYSKVIPVDRNYISRTKYLIFDGNNLVRIDKEPRPKSEEE